MRYTTSALQGDELSWIENWPCNDHRVTLQWPPTDPAMTTDWPCNDHRVTLQWPPTDPAMTTETVLSAVKNDCTSAKLHHRDMFHYRGMSRTLFGVIEPRWVEIFKPWRENPPVSLFALKTGNSQVQEERRITNLTRIYSNTKSIIPVEAFPVNNSKLWVVIQA